MLAFTTTKSGPGIMSSKAPGFPDEPPAEDSTSPPDPVPRERSGQMHEPGWLWQRIQHHKVVEWTLGYIAFAYALLHGAEMLSEAQEWPHGIVRVLSLVLILGVPIASALAWFHGHRARHRVSTAEVFVLTGLLVVAGSVLWWLERSRETSSVRVLSQTEDQEKNKSSTPRKTVAVLPFADLSEKGGQAYFAEGIAQELAGLLGKIPGVRVIGTTSSFQFKGHTADLRSIGEKLGTYYLVQGSVRRAGELIRVNTELTDAREGVQRWSDSYDRKVSDVLQVQDEIAVSVARALQVTVHTDVASRGALKNPEAYDLYLQGLHALDVGSQEATKEAVADFQQALSLEPYGEAAAGLARAYMWAGIEGWLPPRDAFEQARKAAQLALRIDPRLGDAHAALAEVHMIYDWDWSAANREVQRAQMLGSQVHALAIAADLAAARGQWEQARQLLQKALAIDPLNPLLYQQLVFSVYLRAGRYTEAESAMRRTLEISPQYGNAHYFLGEALLLEGRLDQALAAFQQETIDDGHYEGSAMVYHAMGRNSESDAALKAGTAQNGESWPSKMARVHAFRGELDQAMQWLERAYTMRDEDLYALKNDPLMKNLEGDSRYQAFLSKMNFPN